MNLQLRAKQIKLVATDVDGVLTDGRLHYPIEGGPHCKAFHVRDGAAIKWLQSQSIPVSFITGLSSLSVSQRAQDLAITDCFMGIRDKTKSIEQLLLKYRCEWENVAYLGDDLQDIHVLQRVGLAACPTDACDEVKASVHHVFTDIGGSGILRTLAELILKSQGSWDEVVQRYQVKS